MVSGPSTVNPSGFPISEVEGFSRTIAITNPGAGNQWTQTVNGEGAWLLQSLSMVFTPSAAVANRLPRIVYSDSARDIFSVSFGAIAASIALTLSAAIGAGLTVVDTVTGGGRTIGLPAIILPAGFVIKTLTTGMDAGDAFSTITLYVLELPYGAMGYPRGPVILGNDTG